MEWVSSMVAGVSLKVFRKVPLDGFLMLFTMYIWLFLRLDELDSTSFYWTKFNKNRYKWVYKKKLSFCHLTRVLRQTIDLADNSSAIRRKYSFSSSCSLMNSSSVGKPVKSHKEDGKLPTVHNFS